MPIYEFRCKDCGKVSEFQMKMSDPNPQTCPTCGEHSLSKIMSLPSFQLKGGGWYAEGYDSKSNKSASGPKPESSDSASGSAPAKSESTSSSESKPAAASTPAAAPSATPAPSKKD